MARTITIDQRSSFLASRLASETSGQTLQPKALVHEAYPRHVHHYGERCWNNAQVVIHRDIKPAYEMCSGHSPLRADSTIATIRRVCEDTPTPLARSTASGEH